MLSRDHQSSSPLPLSPSPNRVILHADMDCFFVAVEVLDRPELAGKAVCVGGSPTGRGVVSAASYEARKFGVRSAMPMAKAVRLCPQMIRLRGRFERYREMSQRVFEIFRAFSPDVQPISIDEAFIDVTGVQRIFGDGVEIARKIRQRVRDELGLVVSIGVAPNKFVAKLASEMDKPDGLTVAPMNDSAELAAWLAPLPIKCMWGVGPKTESRLRQLGFATFADLQNFPVEKMRALLGEHGVHWRELAWGRDHRPVRTEREAAKSVGKEVTFSSDVINHDQVRAMISRLADQAASRAREKRLEGRTITLIVRYPDFETITRSKTLPAPTDDTDRVFATAWELFERHVPADAAIRLVGVRLQNLMSRPLRARTRDLFADLPPPMPVPALPLISSPSPSSPSSPSSIRPTTPGATGTAIGSGMADDTKHDRLEAALDELRHRHGFDAIRRARDIAPDERDT